MSVWITRFDPPAAGLVAVDGPQYETSDLLVFQR
jgi:hypothetical protein